MGRFFREDIKNGRCLNELYGAHVGDIINQKRVHLYLVWFRFGSLRLEALLARD